VSEVNNEAKNLEDNLPMVNYIMLHRIYDVLTLLAKYSSKDEGSEMSQLIEYHEKGFLLGPVPAFSTEEGAVNE
jgi:hypothetical protein